MFSATEMKVVKGADFHIETVPFSYVAEKKLYILDEEECGNLAYESFEAVGFAVTKDISEAPLLVVMYGVPETISETIPEELAESVKVGSLEVICLWDALSLLTSGMIESYDENTGMIHMRTGAVYNSVHELLMDGINNPL